MSREMCNQISNPLPMFKNTIGTKYLNYISPWKIAWAVKAFLKKVWNNILQSCGNEVYMTFVMYIKFINEAHLCWAFGLSWSALKIIIAIHLNLMLPNKRYLKTNAYDF